MQQKEHLILKLPTANAAALCIVLLDHIIGVLLFFFKIPQENQSTFNLLITAVLMPCTLGALYYLFQYRKKDDQD